MKTRLLITALAVAGIFVTVSVGQTLPNPVIYLIGQEKYTVKDKDNDKEVTFVRYRFGVTNFDAYPDAMFAAAPSLPPCGLNKKASRTWVDIFDQRGKRLYGFCALKASADFKSIWFALPEGVEPPSWVYIEMTDRETGKKYKSNLAETTN